MLNTFVNRMKEFRARLYGSFRYRADALFDLTDTLAGNTQAKSPTELSLNEPFSRKYPSIHDAVDHFYQATKQETSQEERVKS